MTPPFAAVERGFCAGLEEVEAKAHLIVVAEKEAFKVRAMAMAAEEEEEEAPPPPAPAPAPAPPPAPAPAPRAVTPPRPPRPEERSAAPAPAPAAGSSMFAFYDKNGDGVLDKEEVIGMMAHLGFKTDDSYVAGLMEVFASFDADDSGQIEQAEFGALAAFFLRFLRLV